MPHQDQLIPHDHVLRYDFNERLNHWVAAGSFIYLMLTGLAFWSPWLFWIASALGGAELSRMLHPGSVWSLSRSATCTLSGPAR